MDRVDFSIVNTVLKTLCRDNGIERDRKSVMQVATLLLALWKQGVREQDDLLRVAREKWAEAMWVESAAAGDSDSARMNEA